MDRRARLMKQIEKDAGRIKISDDYRSVSYTAYSSPEAFKLAENIAKNTPGLACNISVEGDTVHADVSSVDEGRQVYKQLRLAIG